MTHLLVLACTALALAAGAGRTHPALPTGAFLGIPACLALLPLAAWAPGAASSLAGLLGTEGPLEAITAGVLLALLAEGLFRRRVWIPLAAGVLLGEELNWGQVLLPFATPRWMDTLSARSDQANLHNVAGLGWLWLPLPVAATAALSQTQRWSPVARSATRLSLPLFDPRLPLVWAAVFAATLLARAGGDPRQANESLELAAVVAVWMGWTRPAQGRPPRADGPSPGR